MHPVVIDPGVLIAALISGRGAPAEILVAWREGRFDLIVSPDLLGELEGVLLRPKFRPYVTEEEAREYVDLLKRLGNLAPDPPLVAGVAPDPGDDYLVCLARAVGARCIVSGDKRLARGVTDPPVLAPREFLDRVRPS